MGARRALLFSWPRARAPGHAKENASESDINELLPILPSVMDPVCALGIQRDSCISPAAAGIPLRMPGDVNLTKPSKRRAARNPSRLAI